MTQGREVTAPRIAKACFVYIYIAVAITEPVGEEGTRRKCEEHFLKITSPR